MYVIIVGGGKIGYYLARGLLDEGHEVLVLETNAGRAAQLREELGSVATRGDGCEAAVLAEAGAARADYLIAVTGEDRDNLVACQVAKRKFGTGTVIALVHNPKNEEVFRRLGIDVSVSSTRLILEHIEHEVSTHPLTHLLELRQFGLSIIELKVAADSGIVGRRLGEVRLPPDSVVAALIGPGRGAVVPTADTPLGADDELIVIAHEGREAALRAAFAGG